MQRKSGQENKISIVKCLLVCAAAVCYLLANGQHSVPTLAWIYPVLFLYLLRTSKTAKSLFLLSAIYIVGFIIQWLDVLGMGAGLCIALAIIFSAIKILPYMLYYSNIRNKDSFWATALFPAAMVLVEYAIYLIYPILGGLSDVYTQYQNQILMNFSSLFGVYGVIFIMYWTAAVAVWLYSNRSMMRKAKKGIAVYLSVAGLVFIYGACMAVFPVNANETVRIASITVPVKETLEEDDDVSKVFYSNTFSDENLLNTREKLSLIHNELFVKTKEEAVNGAKIVFWSELNGAVMREDEDALIKRAAQAANENHIYLVISLLTKTPYEDYKENKTIAFNPSGEIVAEYFKTVRSIGELCIKGTGEMESFSSEYGELTSFICSDMASSAMISQAGRKGVDIILVPASDWKAMSPIAIKTAIVRGIENGCSIVRQTNMGISVAADYTGKVLATSNYFTSERKTMVVEIPTQGRATIYPYIGNIFPWGCAVFLIVSFMVYIVKRRKVETAV